LTTHSVYPIITYSNTEGLSEPGGFEFVRHPTPPIMSPKTVKGKRRTKGKPKEPTFGGPIGPLHSQILRTTRYGNPNDIIIPSGNPAKGFAYVFQLSFLSNYTDLTSTFRYYRIVRVEAHFFPAFNSAVFVGAPSVPNGTAACTKNSIDGSPPSSQAQLLSDQTVVIKTLATPWSFNIVPRAAVAVYETTGPAYGPGVSPWIDITDRDVAHYGMKQWIDLHYTTALTTAYSAGVMYFKYHLELAVVI